MRFALRRSMATLTAPSFGIVNAKLENWTEHEIVLRLPSEDELVIPPSGKVARVKKEKKSQTPVVIDDRIVPVSGDSTGPVDFPSDHKGPAIVSSMFADAYREQFPESGRILFVPDTGPTAIRDERGRILAVKGLIQK